MTSTSAIARGDSLLGGDAPPPLPSEIPGVSPEAWADFARVVRERLPGEGDGEGLRPLDAVTESNEVGTFALKPRRLADIGLVERPSRKTSRSSGRSVWVAKFKSPLTPERFLTNPDVQYRAFAKSMRDYAAEIAAGRIVVPEGVTLSGALAILHRCGPSGLATWADESDRFPQTVALFERANEIF